MIFSKRIKIKRGDTFGDILENNGMIIQKFTKYLKKKNSINIRKLQIGNPILYFLLKIVLIHQNILYITLDP